MKKMLLFLLAAVAVLSARVPITVVSNSMELITGPAAGWACANLDTRICTIRLQMTIKYSDGTTSEVYEYYVPKSGVAPMTSPDMSKMVKIGTTDLNGNVIEGIKIVVKPLEDE